MQQKQAVNSEQPLQVELEGSKQTRSCSDGAAMKARQQAHQQQRSMAQIQCAATRGTLTQRNGSRS
jgi:hypothetical protein